MVEAAWALPWPCLSEMLSKLCTLQQRCYGQTSQNRSYTTQVESHRRDRLLQMCSDCETKNASNLAGLSKLRNHVSHAFRLHCRSLSAAKPYKLAEEFGNNPKSVPRQTASNVNLVTL